MNSKFVRVSDEPDEKVEWLWRGYIPYGELTVVSAIPGAGKSSVAGDLGARLTQGAPMPLTAEAVGDGAVMILSSEERVSRIKERFIVAGGDVTRLFAAGRGEISLPGDIDDLEKMIRRKGVRFIVLDPLESYVNGSIGSRKAMRSVLDPLNRLAHKHRVAIVGIRHLTKGTSPQTIYRGAGSVAITAAARSELFITVSQDNPEHRVLSQVKCNLAPLSQSVLFQIVKCGESAKVEWLGFSGITAADALDQPSKRECDALNDAKELLVSILWDGPVLAREVIEIAGNSGVKSATLRRAKVDLKVISQRIGFGRGSTILWVLPDRDDPSVASYVDDIIDDLSEELFHGKDFGQPKRLHYHEKGDEDSQQPSDDDQPEQPV